MKPGAPMKLCIHRINRDDCPSCKPKKPQCLHLRDADNCPTCKRNAVFDSTGTASFSSSGGYVSKTCPEHGTSTPCFVCELQDDVAAIHGQNRWAEVARINEVSTRIWAALDAERHAEAWPAGGKCVHCVYVAEHYCGFCSIEIVEPNYDRERFRDEINKALGAARKNFHAGGYYAGKDAKEILTEGEKNFQDLVGLVDLEVWKASRHYGDKMNGALAATIAKNTAGKFTAEIIADETILSRLELGAMPSDVRERVFAILAAVGGDIQEFVRRSRDDRTPPEIREFAKHIVREYGVRAPRFESFDVPTEFDAGDGAGFVASNGSDSTSKAEYAVHAQEADPARQGEMADQEHARAAGEALDAHREELQALVKTWRGDLRKVGEAVLAGPFTTRGVPGVSKSTASRLYQRVIQAFRAHISKSRN